MDINNHQGLQEASGGATEFGKGDKHPWRERESEPWSAAQASAVCRSLAGVLCRRAMSCLGKHRLQ